jgi:YidC/Oxa1 family membrane protein insertase
VDNQRNLILAVVLSALLFFGWDAGMKYLYPHQAKPVSASSAPAPAPTASASPTRDGGLTTAADRAVEARDLAAALNPAGRVPVVAPGLSGSINLTGALLDDLTTNRHKATLDPKDGQARIFSPAGTPAQHYAQIGWTGQGIELPNPASLWSAPAGAKLTPQTPVTLTWANTTGQVFAITYKIDQDYMITAATAVTNHGAASILVQPFSLLNRTDRTASAYQWNLRSGPFGAFDGEVRFEGKYKDLAEASVINNAGKPNWLGFTDIYWMSVLIPDGDAVSSDFRALGNGLFRADVLFKPVAVAPGQIAVHTTRIFAGAKEGAVLDAYEKSGITNFGHAIDWGWFFWFEKPIFWLLTSLFKAVGNFGFAIILLTVIVRGIMFPVAQRQFASMAAMRSIQPKMKALQERYKDDKQKQQEETLKLYKEEGVNPLAGCLPIFLQIPVFFALYKVLTLAVEMRHQPFVGWLRDLSGPDPLHILNLFGLLDFTPPSFLGIGILALLLGVTMWGQFKLNPAAPDPVQQQMFAIMPWMMMFIMAPFASGLLIYWITSNLLTIAQQKYLYSRHPQLKANVDQERAVVAAQSHRTKGQ